MNVRVRVGPMFGIGLGLGAGKRRRARACSVAASVYELKLIVKESISSGSCESLSLKMVVLAAPELPTSMMGLLRAWGVGSAGEGRRVGQGAGRGALVVTGEEEDFSPLLLAPG